MTFKQGKFYAIQGKTRTGSWLYLQASNSVMDRNAALRRLANATGRPMKYSSQNNRWGAEDPEEDYSVKGVVTNHSPLEVKTFESKDIKLILSNMRFIRENCQSENIDPNSLRIVEVDISVTEFTPEEQSVDEIELRKFALEKLSESEKNLLKVTHWEVYHKLGDRSMFADDEDGE